MKTYFRRFNQLFYMLKYTLLSLFFFPLALAAQFSPFCSGATNGFVVDFELYQNQIHATGFFSTICGKNTGYIAQWTGSQWAPAAMGGIDEGHALAVIDDALFIATYEFGADSNYVLRWNGANLTAIGTVYRTNPNPNLSQTPSIYDIVEFQGAVVVCGEFNWVAGRTVSGIARWNGVAWDSLGGGLSGSLNSNFPVIYPHQMTVFEGNLIVCGNFLKAGGQTVNGIARWNGQNWQALGEGFNDVVYGVGVFNGTLYAGGAFTASGNTDLGLIARWNGTSWENPGVEFEYSTTGATPFVHTLKQVGDSLFIAGGFNQVKLPATAPASGVVVLNSSGQINTLGGGVPNRQIEAIIPYNGGVLVGGGGPTNSGYLGFWNPGTTSVETLFDPQQNWTVYPNPVRDFLILERLENFDYTMLSLRDTNGKRCLQMQITGGTEKIRLPDLPNGVYYIQLFGSPNHSPSQKKIVVLGD